ncbi:homocysteine S-methyltransferase family protein [Thermosipho ferrireducens]|uniref:Methionine synthase n=1 Tax=Thermosipho ferrireducens TaxID=2571116 RepID=A0ABX7S8M2_9BACT|nr:homocysteine S-methyltransferase family protein [Thermosipho ferrireducens]QTA37621.1 homocysteine S-methyltransferase family protein [Thermosipho ferrireducens]
MDRKTFLELLSRRVLFLDGAYGTEFFRYGIKEKFVEMLNIRAPHIVYEIHKFYVKAGVDLLLTNTFSANRIKLDSFKAGDLVKRINLEAVKIAKRASTSEQIIVGNISSTGMFIEPLGNISFDKAYTIFKEQAGILLNAGVDAILIETISDLKELKAAILAVRDISEEIPLIACMTFEKNGVSITGTSVEIFATILNDLDVDVVGINCTLEPEEMLFVFSKLAKYSKKPLCVKPNAGKPIFKRGILSYRLSPERFSRYMEEFVRMGANIVGGCCGTGPEHIKAMIERIGFTKPQKRKILVEEFLSSRTILKSTEPFLIIGERINVSGKKKFQNEIKEMNFQRALELATKQEQEGATAIDVNFGIESILSKEHFANFTKELDKISTIPVSFDIQTFEFLETALKEYVGRPLINSAFSNRKHLEKRLELIKKYGGLLVVLLMDKEVPESAEERLNLALRSVDIIKEHSISLSRIYFDPIVLPAGAGNDYHVTLKTIQLLSKKGLKTIIGLSNLTFGMKNRESMNAAFLALAVEYGANAAIMNPSENVTMSVLSGILMLNGKELIAEEIKLPENSLVYYIVNGKKEMLMEFVKNKLKNTSPIEISQNFLAEAMNKIGELYATGKIYLPQLMLASETVKPVFEYLNLLIEKTGTQKLGTVMLATVQNDIHDIGKNIVATILKSVGFEVIDIGKDVPVEEIIKHVVKFKPDILGLSAMMTTTVGHIKEIVEKLKKSKVETFVIAGGASMNEFLAREFGCYYAKNAIEAVKLCKSLISKKTKPKA